ncbi:CdaR family protein [Brevibacterium metallidurans]|uniref:PucR C-terminal helix-turn-helix domain-containing protein n=1 Tax=Brevibacterium metallidurans TaxID=1482676 RepID=A0ABP3C8Q9_9MICO
MRDLLGKLTALDPEARESLKVVGYFDALTARGVGLGGLLRAAAALSGTVAAATIRGTTTAYDPDGRRLAEVDDASRGSVVEFRLGEVWLDRAGAPHSSDAMITERLALAIEAFESRQGSTREVEVIVDAQRTVPERMTALVRIGIDPTDSVRVIVSDEDPGPGWTWTAPTPTPSGILHTSLEVRRKGAGGGGGGAGGALNRDQSDSGELSTSGSRSRTGIGTWVRADCAPESWEAALVAHRLLGDGPETILDATDLGGMLILARAYDPAVPHPDVAALSELDDLTAEILRTLVDSESIRSAAAKLAMHHSTLQARHETLTARLGYDPRTTIGRMRYTAAEFLRRLGD